MDRYFVRTFGCQMNKHDSERIVGLLEADGMLPAESPEKADVVVFNTCCVRESADERLYGQVASLKALKTGGRPDVLIAVGGCVGQRDGMRLREQLPHVDVVFGTHNIESLPALLEAARQGRPSVQVLDRGETFASDLPSRREHPWHAWVSITVGCDNYCSYCIVPYVRGHERSRPLAAVIAEAENLVADGVVEITLLGQNVNSYGRDLYGQPRFAEMLRAVASTGIERIRFATSHPKDLSDETIRAMAEIPQVCNYMHLPVQSGSNRTLTAMNRVYTREHYLDLISKLRFAIPGLAVSTDVIVGFPGESDEDFADTLDLFKQVGFDQAFTFIYSAREGTPAASLPGRVSKTVTRERFDQLVEVVQSSAAAANERIVGTTQRILLEGCSKRDENMLTGRTDTNKVVHVPADSGGTATRKPGTFIDVYIEQAQTWFLLGYPVSDR
ncbi:MAG: tRNA (N6-isopentenyl adenosine(37)-C2)-methylthiotransferase MiaB [Coriobacteriia bacterium]|nr:tRNA (N6-isopentenyl adenosine(37)-C2)-methylthiotransferase MiaB [Coriobacteriia bacterium]